MRFPEWLYRLLPGDAGSQQLGVVWREASNSEANVVVSATPYIVPADKCLVLTNMTAEFVPGATFTIERRRFMADPPSGTVRYNFLDQHANITNAAQSENWGGEIVIPGGWKVRAEGNFSAATAANSVSAEIHGYLIPRGTFIFG